MHDIQRFYDENGYFGPATAFDPNELAPYNLLPLVSSLAAWPACRNRHLDTPAVANLCRSPGAVDGVRAVLGSNLVLWRSNIFAIAGGYELPWHRDEYNDVLDCRNGASHCSVQINLTDSSERNCVAVIPGSHRWNDEDLRQRGYSVSASAGGTANTPVYDVPDGAQPRDIRLRAGEFYVFHPQLLHASVLRPSGIASDTEPDRVVPARYSITLRIATPGVRVLPQAFAGTPSRAQCVMLSGANSPGVNPIGAWAAGKRCLPGA